MNNLTIIRPVYNPRKEIIDNYIKNWETIPDDARKKLNLIVVDDGSKEVVKFDINYPINLTVVRILKDIYWNNGGAKNLGVSLTKTDWVLLTEMDHIFLKEEVLKLLNFEPIPKTLYRFNRRTFDINGSIRNRTPHYSTFLMETKQFLDIGGYDEDFAGCYGHEEKTFHYLVLINKFDIKVSDITVIENEKYDIPEINGNQRSNGSRNEKRFIEIRNNPKYKPGPIIRFPWEITQSLVYNV